MEGELRLGGASEVTSTGRRIYRRELDGVRAIAVLAVLFFHCGYGWMRGGYLGVDVFFVLSGFLIIGIILDQIEDKNFDFWRFYARRFRRIAPALLALVAVTLAVGVLISIPADLAELGASSVAAILSLSNVFFWRQSGYFDTAAEYKPLLHTWSLSLEEQMYLALPAVLVICSQFARKRPVGAFLAPAGGLLLAGSIFAAELFPSAAFFLAPTRMWEFLAGGALAFWMMGDAKVECDWGFAGVLAGGGLLLVLAPMIWLAPGILSPVLSPVPAVFGTCLLIAFASPSTWVGRLLCSRPMVLVGLASYSIYLWHQPLFAFTRQYLGSHVVMGNVLNILLLVGSMLAGFLSWRFIEKPYRNPALRSRNQLVVYSFVLAIPALLAGAWLSNSKQAAMLSSKEVGMLATPARADPFNCRLSAADIAGGGDCSIGADGVRPSVALIGDSHARRLVGVLDAGLRERGISSLFFADSWCVPLPGVSTTDRTRNPACPAFIASAFEQVLHSDVSVVVLAAQWPAYVDGWRTGDSVPSRYVAESNDGDSPSYEVLGAVLKRTKHALEAHGKSVILVMTVPEHTIDVPLTIARREKHHERTELRGKEVVTRTDYEQRNASTRRMFAVAGIGPESVIEPVRLLCPEMDCMVLQGRNVLYEDSNHMSYAGARLIVPDLLRLIEHGVVSSGTEGRVGNE